MQTVRRIGQTHPQDAPCYRLILEMEYGYVVDYCGVQKWVSKELYEVVKEARDIV